MKRKHTWSLTKSEFETMRNKFNRGSHGGKQMAMLSSKESVYLDMLLESLYLDYPDYIKDTLS